MSLRLRLKKVLEHRSAPVWRVLAKVPFGLKLGPQYTHHRHQLAVFEALAPAERHHYLLQRLQRHVSRVFETNDFYRNHWRAGGFHPDQLRDLDDLKRIPPVTKEELRQASSEVVTWPRGAMPINTGGSSGSPLAFSVDRSAFAREWAHMHTIWARVGFSPGDARLTIRGHSLAGRGFQYNPVHNEYQLDPGVAVEDYAQQLLKQLQRDKVRFVHGYPSSISAFVDEAQATVPALIDYLQANTSGVLLGSEYPHQPYRVNIERRLGTDTISWYGHSEMALLAYERAEPYRYHIMQTYGIGEVSSDAADSGRHLLATSFHNTATPFIRYDTGDLVEDVDVESGILISFAVAEGRVGDFVKDAQGRDLSLTSLIFGRHHRAFEHASYVQVNQRVRGEIDLYVTPNSSRPAPTWEPLFDFEGLDLAVRIWQVGRPIRAKSGKAPLSLTGQHLEGANLPTLPGAER